MDLITQIWEGAGLYQMTGGQAVMLLVCLLLLYLGIVKKFEPLLLVTIGFGGLLSNIPGVEIATGDGLLHLTYVVGIATGAFPLIIFMGVGALTDFGPLLANPRTVFLGAAAAATTGSRLERPEKTVTATRCGGGLTQCPSLPPCP